jgi:Putative transmembrane protein (PGPGW)
VSSASSTGPEERAGPRTPVEPGHSDPPGRRSLRHRMRTTPGLRHVWRTGVFVVGLLWIAAGGALVVLPGPLTIPPIILGLWIWSTEFEWAHRLFSSARKKGSEAWEQAKRRPVASAFVTGGGLLLAGAVIWSVSHFHLVDRAKEYAGLS